MTDKNITFVIFTYNEEKRIERVIRNFKNYGKILIADNKSTDRTQEIARSYGCDVLIREKEYVFVENQEMVDLIYEHINTDWIYWGFADEMLEKQTLDQLQAVIVSEKYSIITMDRKNYFYGKFCYDIYNGYNFKAFKKHAIDFRDNQIHGVGKATVADNEIYKMPDKYFVHHFISNNAASYLNVINRYTESELDKDIKGKQSVFYFVFVTAKVFLKNYFFKKGYRVGFKGLALIELMIFYHLVTNIKHFEHEFQLNASRIEDENNIHRERILHSLNVNRNENN